MVRLRKLLIAIGKPIQVTLKRAVTEIRSLKINWGYMVLTVMAVGATGGCWLFYREVLWQLPSINLIYNPPKMSTKITDSKGRILFKFYDGENRSWVPLEKIPQSLVEATVAIEDKNFFKHSGLSVKGVAMAVYYNFFKKGEDNKYRGGSTITQQLVKNVFLDSDQTWKRKAREAILSVMIEGKLSKKEILERYFNQVSYGGEAYGVQEAAMRLFGKNVWEITTAEAAFLAGLPAAPSSYSPYGKTPYYAFLRQKHVIEEMKNAGYISEERAVALKQEQVVIQEGKTEITAPHFVFYIRDWLTKKYGVKDIGRQGLTVITTVDSDWQKEAEKITKEEVEKAKGLGISNGGMVVMGVKEGEILAMVGSKDYEAKDIDGKYNVVTAERQPGSSIKPINYLLALERGKTLLTPIADSPVTYYIKGQEPYTPRNYTGKFLGTVTIKTALAASLNVPSVKLLAENGVGKMIDLAEKMGIETWTDRSRYGLSLALGGGEVKMIDMAQAYSVFANLGQKIEINPIKKIENYLGEVVYQKEVEGEMVVAPKYTFLINEALSDDQARAPVFGLNSKLKIGNKKVAVKTGTTNNLKDNWCIGWTPSFLVAVWVGNNDGTPMNWVASGISGATPIWNRMMTKLLEGREEERWQEPEGVYRAKVCGREEYFTDGREKGMGCVPKPTGAN